MRFLKICHKIPAAFLVEIQQKLNFIIRSPKSQHTGEFACCECFYVNFLKITSAKIVNS